MNGIVKSRCWIIDAYYRKAVVQERGLCRKICKKSSEKLEILKVVFCKKKGLVTHIKYDFSIRNCSQILKQNQLCFVKNISYDNSSDAFPVRLKLHRCRKHLTA